MMNSHWFSQGLAAALWLTLCLPCVPSAAAEKLVENVPVDTDWTPATRTEARNTNSNTGGFDDASLHKFIGDLQCDGSAQNGTLQTAKNMVARLLGERPANPNVWLALAEEKLRSVEINCNCNPDSGIDAALKAQAMAPDSPAPYLTAAKIHLFEGWQSHAKRDVEEAVKRGARNADAAQIKALIAANRRDYATVVQLLTPAVAEIDQTAPRAIAYESIGNAYRAMNQRNDAEKMYRMGANLKSCASTPEQSLAQFLLFEKSDSAGAKTVLAELMQRLPTPKTRRLMSVADYYRLAGSRMMSREQRAELKELAQSAYVAPEEVFVEGARFESGQFLLQNLLAAGAIGDVDAKDGESDTALISAAMGNNLTAARYLLDKRARADSENSIGQRALGFFSANGNVDAVKLLLARHADADYADRNGESPLKEAVRGGHVDVARILLQSKKSFKLVNISAMLSLAALQGNAEMAELFLSAHANVNESANGVIAPLIGAILSHDRATIRLLLEKKADPQVRHAGKSALEYARETGDEEIVKMIVRLAV